MNPTTTSFISWWNAESPLFSKMCSTEEGETFTHGQVVMIHAILFFVLIIGGLFA